MHFTNNLQSVLVWYLQLVNECHCCLRLRGPRSECLLGCMIVLALSLDRSLGVNETLNNPLFAVVGSPRSLAPPHAPKTCVAVSACAPRAVVR